MTTATKTRSRKTKKKKVVAKKKKAANGRRTTKAKSKKPKWTLITFKQLEGWRQKLGLSKSGMAEALQVTNSTYHNWRRGTTVPHPNQQSDILQRIRALETNAAAGGGAGSSGGSKASKAGKAAKSPRGKRPRGSNNNSPRNRLSGLDGSGSSGIGAVSGAAPGADNGSRPCDLGIPSPGTPLASAKVPRDDIASITVAYIQSQKKEVSAGSIISFVDKLRKVL